MLRLATRRNGTALRRANAVAALLRSRNPHIEVQLVDLNTAADRALEAGSAEVVGKGPCAREVQRAVLEHQAEVAVHAMKDLPLEGDPRLTLVAVPPRVDARDTLCAANGWTLTTLPSGARVGTNSPRRHAQLLRLREDLAVVPLRGTLERRLARVGAGVDAVIVSYGALQGMGLTARATHVFTLEEMLPACGQGAIALESRLDDPRTLELVGRLDDAAAHVCVMAERTVVKKLGAAPQAPLAVFATVKDDIVTLRAWVGSTDGTEVLRAEKSGPSPLFGKTAAALVDDLLRQGAAPMLRAR